MKLWVWLVPSLAATFVLAGCGSPEETVAPARPTSIGRTSRTYSDDTRPRWRGAGPRPLSVVLWYPAESGTPEVDWFIGPSANPLFRLGRSGEGTPVARLTSKRPLVVLSHGTGGSAAMLAWLGEALARAGYIVAAINHHGNTSAEESPTPEGFMLWWERATDLTRVLDRLLSDPQFGSLVDARRVGAAGFSLGGYSVLAVAGARTSLVQWETFCRSVRRDATCNPQPEFPEAMTEFDTIRDRSDVQQSLGRHGDSFRDGRFKAILAMAPVGSWLTDDSLEQVTVPVRVVVGSDDRTAPHGTNAKRVAERVPGAQLSVLDSVGHYTFLAECTDLGVKELPRLCLEQPGVDRTAVHRLVEADAVAFFNGALGAP